MATEEFPDSFADVLGGVQRLIRRRLRAGMTEPRLRGAQVELLRLVMARPGIRVSAAAKELYLAGNSVSTLVNQLVKAGYLHRETDPEDRRSARLTATPAAEARLREWQARRGSLVRDPGGRIRRGARGP
ncbi:MarR family winged helix-turn-helix transcriptional regulator [Streptomyces asiaticus]